MAEPTAPTTAPTGGDTIPGPVPRDPPAPPGYVDPVGQSPVLDGLLEKVSVDEGSAPDPDAPERDATSAPARHTSMQVRGVQQPFGA